MSDATVAEPLGERLRRSASSFFLAEGPVTPVVAFRVFLALWLFAFWAPRVPHVWELYCRPVLRHVHKVVKWLEHPLPPLWLMQGALIVLLALLIGFAFSRRPRVFHVLVFGPMCLLFAFDTLMPRAYGGLAFIQLAFLFLAPYDQLRDDDDGAILDGPVLGQRFLQLQFSSVYVFTVPAKLYGGQGWLDGSVLWKTFHNPRYGDWLLSHWIDIPMWACKAACYGTLIAELYVGIGLWFRRTRLQAMVICVCLHTAMTLSLRVSILFPTLMFGHLLLFLTDDEWRRVMRWWEARRPGWWPGRAGRLTAS
jgi:hypothetical protein